MKILIFLELGTRFSAVFLYRASLTIPLPFTTDDPYPKMPLNLFSREGGILVWTCVSPQKVFFPTSCGYPLFTSPHSVCNTHSHFTSFDTTRPCSSRILHLIVPNNCLCESKDICRPVTWYPWAFLYSICMPCSYIIIL